MEQKKGLRKLGSNIIIFTIGSFASKMMNYFMLPFYTSILTQAEYGTFDIIATTSNLLYPFTTLLITEATMRFALDKKYDSAKVFSLSIIVSFTGFFIYLIFSPLILLSKLYNVYYLHFVMYHLFVTIHTLISQFTKGIEETKKYAFSGIIGTVFTLSSNFVFMLLLGWSLKGYFISFYIGSLISIVYLLFSCRLWNYISRIKRKDAALLREMLRYSLPIMPNSISWWISTSSDKYFISYFVGMEALGLYSISYKIPSLMTVFTTIFFNAWNISAVEEFGTKESNQRFSQVYSWFFSVIFLLSSVIILLSKFISMIMFSEEFFDAWRFIPFLIVAYVFHDLSAYIGSIYTASKKTEMLFISTLIGACVNIVLNIIFIAKWAAIGAAITTLISYCVVWLVRTMDTRKYGIIDCSLLKDGICILLLLCEMIIVFLDKRYSFTLAMAIVVMIMLIIRPSLRDLLKSINMRSKSKKS